MAYWLFSPEHSCIPLITADSHLYSSTIHRCFLVRSRIVLASLTGIPLLPAERFIALVVLADLFAFVFSKCCRRSVNECTAHGSCLLS